MSNKIRIDSHPCVGMAKRILTKQDIYHLPSVTAQVPLFIPTVPAVYFIFHKKEIVYIGATSCLAERISNHKIITEYDNKNTRIYFLILPTDVMRRKFEHKFIEQFQPRLNIKREFRPIDFLLTDFTEFVKGANK